VAAALGVDEALIRHYLGKTGKQNHRLPSLEAWEKLSDLLPFDWWIRDALSLVDAEYETADRGNRQIAGRLSGGALDGDKPKVVPTGWTDCGHNNYRPGIVLDPFGGSGTTAVAAARTGRDAVLIDIDERNLDLTRHRLASTFRIVDETSDGTATTFTVEERLPNQAAQAAGQTSIFDFDGDAA
jgi:hypothetical protein